jgi:hypothetical protein
VTDPRAKYFKRLRRLRRSARRASILAGGAGAAAAVLVPYAGLGWPDAIWAAVAGGSAVVTAWRWRDARELAAQPPPPAIDPAEAAARTRQQLLTVVHRLPGGPQAVEEIRRARRRRQLRGYAAAGRCERLDRAAGTLDALAGRLTGAADSALLEAAVAERSLRDLAHRTVAVEKGLRLATGPARVPLEECRRGLLAELDGGVEAYERLVVAAAGYVAEDGHSAGGQPAVARLAEATEMLRAFAAGLAEARRIAPQV